MLHSVNLATFFFKFLDFGRCHHDAQPSESIWCRKDFAWCHSVICLLRQHLLSITFTCIFSTWSSTITLTNLLNRLSIGGKQAIHIYMNEPAMNAGWLMAKTVADMPALKHAYISSEPERWCWTRSHSQKLPVGLWWVGACLCAHVITQVNWEVICFKNITCTPVEFTYIFCMTPFSNFSILCCV
jgi:hypothetical protein